MRSFYIFNINKNIANLYKNNEFVLYDILYEIYKLDRKDVIIGFKFFKQFVNKINKKEINIFLYNSLKNNMTYTTILDNHKIIDKLHNEFSELIIHNSHILLKSNTDISKLLIYLLKYQKNFFVCDFESKDYFWLNSIIKTVK